MKAGNEAGYIITDYNDEDQEGLSYIQTNTRNGVRSSISVEYLESSADRTNLHIAVKVWSAELTLRIREQPECLLLETIRSI